MGETREENGEEERGGVRLGEGRAKVGGLRYKDGVYV